MHNFDQLTLFTTRLILRPLHKNDAPALFAIFSDPKVMRYWSTPPWDSIDKAHLLIAQDLETMATGSDFRLGIEHAENRQLIGTCSLYAMNAQCRRAEIGYALSSPFWGYGYMHEALCVLLEYGFSTHKLNRVEADIDPRNQASANCLIRLGFKKEGMLRERWIVNGEKSDTDLYGLLLSDWRSRS